MYTCTYNLKCFWSLKLDLFAFNRPTFLMCGVEFFTFNILIRFKTDR